MPNASRDIAYLVDFRILVGEHAFELWLEQSIDCTLGHDVGMGAASFYGVQSGSSRCPRTYPTDLKRVGHVFHQPIAKFSQDLLLTLESGFFVRVLVFHLRERDTQRERERERDRRRSGGKSALRAIRRKQERYNGHS